MVLSGGTQRGKRGTKGPPAHLISFLVQACSTLPDYILVFAKVCVLSKLVGRSEGRVITLLERLKKSLGYSLP